MSVRHSCGSLRSSAAADGGRCLHAGVRKSATNPCCDPRPPRTAAAARAVHPVPAEQDGCDPRPPRAAAAAPDGALKQRVTFELRSSAAADGGRCRPCRARRARRRAGCDPRPPRTAAAATGLAAAGVCGERRCDPRPPRTAAAAPDPALFTLTTYPELRSSAAADGGRCRLRVLASSAAVCVAILGRRGRRPLRCTWRSRSCPTEYTLLRSSAAADGGRCAVRELLLIAALGCDPRPPRTAAAARREPGVYAYVEAVAILGRRGRRPLPWTAGAVHGRRPCCDPRPPRTAAAADGSPASSPGPRSCDPRPPRTAAAARCRCAASPRTTPLRSSAAADGGRCPRRTPAHMPQQVLRSSAAADGGRCCTTRAVLASRSARLRSSAAADGGRCLDLQPGRGHPPLGVAILGRRGRRPLPTPAPPVGSGAPSCDPRPPRTAAAASATRPAASPCGSCCDPRPPRTATAALIEQHKLQTVSTGQGRISQNGTARRRWVRSLPACRATLRVPKQWSQDERPAVRRGCGSAQVAGSREGTSVKLVDADAVAVDVDDV